MTIITPTAARQAVLASASNVSSPVGLQVASAAEPASPFEAVQKVASTREVSYASATVALHDRPQYQKLENHPHVQDTVAELLGDDNAKWAQYHQLTHTTGVGTHADLLNHIKAAHQVANIKVSVHHYNTAKAITDGLETDDAHVISAFGNHHNIFSREPQSASFDSGRFAEELLNHPTDLDARLIVAKNVNSLFNNGLLKVEFPADNDPIKLNGRNVVGGAAEIPSDEILTTQDFVGLSPQITKALRGIVKPENVKSATAREIQTAIDEVVSENSGGGVSFQELAAKVVLKVHAKHREAYNYLELPVKSLFGDVDSITGINKLDTKKLENVRKAQDKLGINATNIQNLGFLFNEHGSVDVTKLKDLQALLKAGDITNIKVRFPSQTPVDIDLAIATPAELNSVATLLNARIKAVKDTYPDEPEIQGLDNSRILMGIIHGEPKLIDPETPLDATLKSLLNKKINLSTTAKEITRGWLIRLGERQTKDVTAPPKKEVERDRVPNLRSVKEDGVKSIAEALRSKDSSKSESAAKAEAQKIVEELANDETDPVKLKAAIDAKVKELKPNTPAKDGANPKTTEPPAKTDGDKGYWDTLWSSPKNWGFSQWITAVPVVGGALYALYKLFGGGSQQPQQQEDSK